MPIPFVLEVAASLTAFTRPNHIASLCSWGFACLSPCCNANYFGYKLLCLLAGMTFLPAQAAVNAPDYQAFWLWSAVRPQPVLAQAESLYILQGQISERLGQTRFIPQGISTPRLRHGKVWLTYRVETLVWPEPVFRTIEQQINRWKKQGNPIVGIQIDFDARTLRMQQYVSFLHTLRQQLPAQYALSITGLLDWSNHSSPDVVNQLSDVVDEVVVQTYQGKQTIKNYEAYLPRLAQLRIPFKVGLVQHGEWHAPDYLETAPFFRGYVVFLLNEPN